LTEQYDEFRAAGAEVIALVKDTEEAARSYFSEHNIPFPCLADPEHTVYDQYEVHSKMLSLGQRPALFVIDREGLVQYAYLGWQQWEIPPNDVVLEVCRGIPCYAEIA
jgi:thioredoxin-dependent peroxiredoxin